ncbi:hypothetical protein [Candidatus Pyrohabitans sp.]
MKREKLGLMLIILGIAVWPLAAVFQIAARTALVVHLSFIIPGVYLRRSRLLTRFRRK